MTDEAPAPTLKFDLSRNYYADLELQEKTDDVSLIKRQYRRLCMWDLSAFSSSIYETLS